MWAFEKPYKLLFQNIKLDIKLALTLFLPLIHEVFEAGQNLFFSFSDVVDLEGSQWSYLKLSPDLPKYITNVFGGIFDVSEEIQTKESYM